MSRDNKPASIGCSDLAASAFLVSCHFSATCQRAIVQTVQSAAQKSALPHSTSTFGQFLKGNFSNTLKSARHNDSGDLRNDTFSSVKVHPWLILQMRGK